MSLFGALNIGSSALSVQQAALQVTGNNIANAGNADYTREIATILPGPDQQLAPGLFIGSGVNLTDIKRQISDSLEARIRGSGSDTQAASTTQDWLNRVQTTFNALGTTNISTQFAAFFTSWSSLANTPQDPGLRQVVLQDGQGVVTSLTNERTQLNNIQSDAQQQIADDAKAADGLAQQVADLNGQIVISEGGTAGTANALRDQRDAALSKLSQMTGIQTVNQGDGSVNVYVGSEPLVIGTQNSGITVQQKVVNGTPQSTVVFKSTGGPLNPKTGELGSLEAVQTQIGDVTAQVDNLAHTLIFAVNKLHASGQGTAGISSVTSSNVAADPTAPLNSAAAGLQFTPTNGSFVVHVRDKASGLTTSTLVQVNLTGSPADTTLNSLSASLNAVNGVKATIANGKLTIASLSNGSEISFSQDSSSVLASLGVNTFFTGSDASNIAVNTTLKSQPTLLAAAKNGDSGDNQTALAIAALNTTPLASLDNSSLQDSYQTVVNGVAGQVASATVNTQATKAVQDTLSAQHASLSGVNIDEEAVHMIQQQRAYQGAAILITTINSMMASLLAMVH